MVKHKYLNYTQIVKDHPEQFSIMLLFKPQLEPPTSQIQPEQRLNAPFKEESSNVVGISLPAPFCLMMVSQLQIIATQRFGTLISETFIKKGKHQKLQIQGLGASYLEHLTPEELQNIETWFARVCATMWQ